MIAFVCIGDRPYAKYAVKSFKKHMPKHEFVQICDPDSPVIDGVDRVIRQEWNGYLMVYLIKAFADLECEDTLITTADDCIISRPFDDWMEGDYDVAISRRKDKGEGVTRIFPYTNGLVFVKNKQFYKDCYESILGMLAKEYSGRPYWHWWGDMACIAEVIDSGKYKVKDLPVELFCVKPWKNGKLNKPGSNLDPILWHYSGLDRKPWMENHPQ